MAGLRIYVPGDAAAVACGADGIAKAIPPLAAKRKVAVEIVRNGSRGMHWLEPMLEVVTDKGRIAYGPVEMDDLESVFDAMIAGGAAHKLRVGVPEEHPFLKKQTRLTFARCGIVDPHSLDEYLAHDGYKGLMKALADPAGIVAAVTESGLRGRGGAGFPTGIKWKTVADAQADRKYIVCNADEGDSGTFADRMIMEGDPFVLIEGMTIAGIAVGATRGYVYIRSEYPHAIAVMNDAIRTAKNAGYLGRSVAGSAFAFDIEVRVGAGAYVCGEETALLESLEGRRGQVRAKPPLPAHKGLFGKPTVINNVLSLASVPVIMDRGAAYYKNFGVGRSRGTMPIQLAGNLKYGGLFETAFGITLGELVHLHHGAKILTYCLLQKMVSKASNQVGSGQKKRVVQQCVAIQADVKLHGHIGQEHQPPAEGGSHKAQPGQKIGKEGGQDDAFIRQAEGVHPSDPDDAHDPQSARQRRSTDQPLQPFTQAAHVQGNPGQREHRHDA
ncbi:MAG: hypothetical protein DPW22_06825, partial [Alphaproteobacteria bacterium]|nr:hypothetical protein [Alphaproteobacteria bacterium]